MNKYLIILIYFFTFVFNVIFEKGNIVISFSLFICILSNFLLIMELIKKRNKVKINKSDNLLIIITLLYVFYTSIIAISIGIEDLKLLKVIFNNVYLIFFIFLIILLQNYEETFRKIKNMICYFAIIVGLFGILLYSQNIFNINFDTNFPFIHFLDISLVEDMFKEYRYQYTYTHKIRYGYYCILITYLFLSNKSINKYIKYLGIFLMCINIIISNTATALVCFFIIFSYFIYNNNRINKYLKIILNIIVVCSFLYGLSYLIGYISTERDVFTLGNRTLIWEGVINEILKYPWGVIDHYTFHNFYYNKVPFIIGSTHNVFLGESLDYGIMGGILYLIIFIAYFKNLNKYNDNIGIIVIITLILFMFDIVLGKEGFSMFFLSYFLLRNNETSKNSI